MVPVTRGAAAAIGAPPPTPASRHSSIASTASSESASGSTCRQVEANSAGGSPLRASASARLYSALTVA